MEDTVFDMPTTLSPSPMPSANDRAGIVLVIGWLRGEAGKVARELFPETEGRKRYALPLLPMTTISKARNGSTCNPVFRASLMLLSLKVAGRSAAEARLMVEYLNELVERWWPVTEEDDGVFDEYARVDAMEDVARRDFELKRPGAADKFLHLSRRVRAYGAEVIRRLEVRAA